MNTIAEKDVRTMADEWGELQLQIAPLAARAAEIEKAVKEWLKTSGRELTITGKLAIAKRETVRGFGSREISLDQFMAAAKKLPKAERDECLKVVVGAAEKLLGKVTVDRISIRPTTSKTVETLELK
jgi:hypothetical protein